MTCRPGTACGSFSGAGATRACCGASTPPLRDACRARAGRHPAPSAALLDSRSVKTTEKGSRAASTRPSSSRAASATCSQDTDGLLLACHVYAADVQERAGAKRLLRRSGAWLLGAAAAVDLDGPRLLGRALRGLGARALAARAGRGALPQRHPAQPPGARPARVGGLAPALGGRAHLRLAGPLAPPFQRLRGQPALERSTRSPGHDWLDAPSPASLIIHTRSQVDRAEEGARLTEPRYALARPITG